MTPNPDSSRERGIEMGNLPERLEAASFPLGKEELLEEYGQHELVFPDEETSTLEAVLNPAGVHEFQSVDELLQTIYHMVGSSAVGRRGQTGRGTSHITPPREHRPPGKPESGEGDNQSL